LLKACDTTENLINTKAHVYFNKIPKTVSINLMYWEGLSMLKRIINQIKT
jgi:hypothetical protein